MTPQLGESTRLPIDTIFFKPLKKSIVIVHYIPGLFFAKLVLYRAGLAVGIATPRLTTATPRLTIATPRLVESAFECLKENAASRGVANSPTRRVFF